MGLYLDYNASSPIDSRVLEYMVDVYKNHYGNADSRTHEFGNSARHIVEIARKSVADILGVAPEEVFFTSGATESNNIAIQGLMEYADKVNKRHIITSSIEHKSVLETAKHMQYLGFDVDFVNPDLTGRVNVDGVMKLVRDDTLLVSIMHVNNETGIIQPVKELGALLKDKNVLFHIDATQSFGKLVKELQSLQYNMMSLSAHKFGGPQGVGALILRREKYKLPPVKSIVCGGQQEHGIRPGTVPVALVAGLGKACEIAMLEYKKHEDHCRMIKNRILEILSYSGLDYSINGNQEYCVNNTLNICIDGVSSEALMLSSKQFCGISNGSACNSNSYSPSYVLVAMGIETSKIENSIRVSWGQETELEEITENFSGLVEIAKSLAW